MILHNYFRSSASFRVRIALNLKGLDYQYISVHLTRNGGEQLTSAFAALNTDKLVPVLEHDGHVLTQSLAIMEYLEEQFPTPALLPTLAVDRAHVRAMALQVACEIHPLNNLRVLRYLKSPLGISEEAKDDWYRHWVEQGLGTLEQRLEALSQQGKRSDRFCFGDAPTLADCCLVPQIFNAQRFNSNLSHVPRLMQVHEQCMALPAFANAQPSLQPDAQA